MFKKISIPVLYSLVQRGKNFLLLHNDYKDFLLLQGIEEVRTFLKEHLQETRYLDGRTPHPSVPIKDGKRMVIREYSHGGLLRAITKNLYLFGTRSFRELILTEEIRSCGIPTIQPIGAIHDTLFPPFYRAYLFTLEIPHALNLIQYLQQTLSLSQRERMDFKRKVIRKAGLLLRQFHQAGFYHNDLQLKNLLVVEDQVLLIDFDRSYHRATLSLREKIKNLLRLNRSVEKWKRFGLPITRTDRWRFLMAYAGEDQTIREALRRVLRTYRFRHLFYKMGWTLEKIVRSVYF
jgi:3-deoxy-D-manno-octulosonic acid kinase